MTVIAQTLPQPTALPGLGHSTWAGHDEGLTQLSMWRQIMAPGAATPPHDHDCDEVVLCLSGHGEVHLAGRVHRFGPASTVVLPKGRPHQIFNSGDTPLEILGVFGSSPVATRGPDGQALALPWRS